jgi:hypothetical protein
LLHPAGDPNEIVVQRMIDKVHCPILVLFRRKGSYILQALEDDAGRAKEAGEKQKLFHSNKLSR